MNKKDKYFANEYFIHSVSALYNVQACISCFLFYKYNRASIERIKI